MPHYDHLQLVRLPERFERRKHGGAGPPPARDLAEHSRRLRSQLNGAVGVQQTRRAPEFIDPSLILRVRMTGDLLVADWESLGLTVLSSDAGKTLILFANDDEMATFRARLEAYEGGAPPNQKNPPYNQFISTIEAIGGLDANDRIGPRFRDDGFSDSAAFITDTLYLADVELWDFGNRTLRERKLAQIVSYIEARDGEVFEQYVGPRITLVRVRVNGALMRSLLELEDVSTIDQPPTPDVLGA